MTKSKKDNSRSDWPVEGGQQDRQRHVKTSSGSSLKEKWRQEFSSPLVGVEVTGAKGCVAALTSSGSLTLLNLEGEQIAEAKPGKKRKGLYPVQAAQFVGDDLFVARESKFQCYDRQSLEMKWEVEDQAGRDLNAGRKLMGEEDFAQGFLGVNGKHVITGSFRGAARRFDTKTGELADVVMTYADLKSVGGYLLGAFRENELGRGQSTLMPMNANPNKIVIGDGNKRYVRAKLCCVADMCCSAGLSSIACFKLGDGTIVWQTDYELESDEVGMCSDGERVFVHTTHDMSCYSAATGEVTWARETKNGSYGMAQPIVTDDSVIAVVDNELIESRNKKSGNVEWVSDPFDAELTSLSSVDGHVFTRTERSIVCLHEA